MSHASCSICSGYPIRVARAHAGRRRVTHPRAILGSAPPLSRGDRFSSLPPPVPLAGKFVFVTSGISRSRHRWPRSRPTKRSLFSFFFFFRERTGAERDAPANGLRNNCTAFAESELSLPNCWSSNTMVPAILKRHVSRPAVLELAIKRADTWRYFILNESLARDVDLRKKKEGKRSDAIVGWERWLWYSRVPMRSS